MPSETKWTPGPWSVLETAFDGQFQIISAADREKVRHLRHINARTTYRPNAHLIAAAPDLYAGLEQERKDVFALLAILARLIEASLMQYDRTGLDDHETTAFHEIQQRHNPTIPSAALAKARGEMPHA